GASVTVAWLAPAPAQLKALSGAMRQCCGTPSAASAAMQSQPGVQPPPAMSTLAPTVNLPKSSMALQLANASTRARLEIARNGQPSQRRADERDDAAGVLLR